jgi:hypothetical protein
MRPFSSTVILQAGFFFFKKKADHNPTKPLPTITTSWWAKNVSFSQMEIPLNMRQIYFNTSLSCFLLFSLQMNSMKKLLLLCALLATVSALQAQGLKGLLKKATGDTSVNQIIGSKKGTSLSSDEIINGLKEALRVGADNSTKKLSSANGFFADAAVKILMPDEAKKVEQKLRSIGMGKQVDNAILAMNRAAEDAAQSATPIFINAIKGITIQDGLGILRGNDVAATNYLKDRTLTQLTDAFRPVIEQSLEKVDATKHWKSVFSTYNTFSPDKVNTDLTAYVTEKALAGIFYQVGLEEQKIRKDPMARTTDLLKKVFN